MCIGVPMLVSAVPNTGTAVCGGGQEGSGTRTVDTLLLDSPARPGDWLLVHVGVAIRALDAEEARQIADALRAVTAAAAGEPFEHLLADLIDREPQLPPHLRQPDASESGHG
jgi:hydrogenase expression/formation protein HypC